MERNKETEEWRDVLNYEGFYQVSSLGRIRSMSRSVKHSRNPNLTKKVIGRIILQTFAGENYLKVRLSMLGNKKTKLVHNLVAQSFLNYPKRIKGFCIDHIDDNRTNNRKDNLQIISEQENVEKSFLVRGALRINKLDKSEGYHTIDSLKKSYKTKLDKQ